MKQCVNCLKKRGQFKHDNLCLDCFYDLYQELLLLKSGRAYSKVNTAIQQGKLPPLDGSIECVDCGAVATAYDHRDYNKPLQVEPVCASCNWHRGPAIAFEANQSEVERIIALRSGKAKTITRREKKAIENG